MNPNDNSANNGFTVTSSEGISQGAVEGGTTSSATIVPKADTSSPPLRIAGAITPEGEIVPVPTDPTIPRSPFDIVNPVTNEVFIQLTGQSDNSTAATGVTANAPPLSVGGSPPTQPLFRKLSYEEWKALAETPTGISSTAAMGAVANPPPMNVGNLPPPNNLPYVSSTAVTVSAANAPPLTMNGVYYPTASDSYSYIRDSLNDEQRYEIEQKLVRERWIVLYNSKPYMFYNRRYVPLNDILIIRMILWMIHVTFGIDPKPIDVCHSILKSAIPRAFLVTVQANDDRYTIFINGSFDNTTGYFYENQILGDYFHTMIVEANFLGFDVQLDHPVTDKFFGTISGGDTLLIELLYEVIGYCISPDAKAKAIFVLYGPNGDNGKSTFLRMLESFISDSGVEHKSMKTLLGDRFAIGELTDKRINISGDEGAVDISKDAIGKLKSLSGGDKISAPVKFQNQVKVQPSCKILIASNYNIGMAYSAIDKAFARRIVPIPFDYSVPKDQQDPYLLNKLLAERDAVCTEAMWHYMKLKRNNYSFTNRDAYIQDLSFGPSTQPYELVRQFSNEYCEFTNPETFIYSQELYEAFVKKYGGDVFKDLSAFSQAFYKTNENRVDKDRKRTGNINQRGFYGVRLKEVLQ